MKTVDRISKAATDTLQSFASLIKVALMSRGCSKGLGKGGEIVILANGPSLRKTIEERGGWLRERSRMAVNFAANTPEFFDLKPDFYVLADPHFFNGETKDPNVKRLWDNLACIDWPMTLWVPWKYARAVGRHIGANVTVKRYNLTPVEGWKWLRHVLFSAGLGMPRPRNVLIPAIMIAMRERFDKIWLAGADHSWLQSLWVDDDNHVVSVQPHFYDDNEKEKARVQAEYAGYHLHDILGSMTVAFRSYFTIREYADSKGIGIVNITPGSYIDAFPRR